MSKIIKLDFKQSNVTHRVCPDCGYMISQLQADAARFNFECHRCLNKKISDFQPLNLSSEIAILKPTTTNRDAPLC